MARNYSKKKKDDEEYRKKSGCSYKPTARNGKPCVHGWNKSQTRGFITAVASPDDDGLYTAENGNEYQKWTVKIEFNGGF